MKTKSAYILILLSIFTGCKEDKIIEPKHLIQKEVMVDIMYDLSLLEASRYQSMALSDSLSMNPREFVLEKYKIDSLQFAQNNIYYASDYKEYKKMVESISERLEKEKKIVDVSIKADAKKALRKKKVLLKLSREKAKKDSLNNKKKPQLVKASDPLK